MIKRNLILEKSINKRFEVVEVKNTEIDEYLKKWCIDENHFKFYVKNTSENNKGEQQFLKFLKMPFKDYEN